MRECMYILPPVADDIAQGSTFADDAPTLKTIRKNTNKPP